MKEVGGGGGGGGRKKKKKSARKNQRRVHAKKKQKKKTLKNKTLTKLGGKKAGIHERRKRKYLPRRGSQTHTA